jgi:Tfp pilus assembly protein PilX/cytoskeletal protein CcmA (bactofilin family)
MIINSKKEKKVKFFFNNQKGMALITTLIFIFVLVSFSVALLVMTSNDSKLSTLHRESTRAFYLAETGVDKALWYLNTSTDQGGYGLNWRTNVTVPPVPPGPLTDGTANEYYEVTVETTTPPGPGVGEILTIHSMGKEVGEGDYDKGTRLIEVKLEEGTSPSAGAVYNYALMTYNEDSNLTFNGHVKIEGDVHSNGDITGNGWDPEDDVDGDVSYSGDGTDLGDAENVSQKEVQAFPAIDLEYYEDEAESGPGQVYEADTAYEISGSLVGIHYFKGDVVISNDLDVYGTIVVEGNITVQGHPEINLVQAGAISLVMVASGNVTLNGNVHITGIIHTKGEITLNGTTNVEEGAILAEDGVVNGTGAETKIVYNVDNQDQPVPGTGIPVWKIASWREIY